MLDFLFEEDESASNPGSVFNSFSVDWEVDKSDKQSKHISNLSDVSTHYNLPHNMDNAQMIAIPFKNKMTTFIFGNGWINEKNIYKYDDTKS